MMYLHSTELMRCYGPNTGLWIVEMQITNDREGICKECVMTALGPVAEFLSTSRNITT